jgi:hypothetical protein
MNDYLYRVKGIKVKSLIFEHIFKCYIDDLEMNTEIKKIIDEQGDRQYLTTNVKAQMTEWNMGDMPGFRKLKFIFEKIIEEVSLERQKRAYKIYVGDIWGLKYKSNDYAVEHDHWPALWSFSYYIDPPIDGPKVIFTNTTLENNTKIEIVPENGLMLIFPSYFLHSVEKKEFKGVRYVVSGNGN